MNIRMRVCKLERKKSTGHGEVVVVTKGEQGLYIPGSPPRLLGAEEIERIHNQGKILLIWNPHKPTETTIGQENE